MGVLSVNVMKSIPSFVYLIGKRTVYLSFEHIIENIIYTVNIYKLKNSKDFLKVSILVVDSEQKQGYYFYI